MAFVGAGHFAGSFALRAGEWEEIWAAGLWRSITLEPGPAELAVEEAFWFSAGSFALPLLLVGAHVLWARRRHLALPHWLGWPVLAWGLLLWVALPVSPAVLVPVAGVLLLIGARTESGGRARPFDRRGSQM